MTLILDHASSSRASSLRPVQEAMRLVRVAISRLGALIAAEIDRRQTMQLLEFDARALKDMGISHADVEGALLVPISRKPSYSLADRRAEAQDQGRLDRQHALAGAAEAGRSGVRGARAGLDGREAAARRWLTPSCSTATSASIS